jgi:hypothetical protein
MDHYGEMHGSMFSIWPLSKSTNIYSSEITDQIWANMKLNCQINDEINAVNNITGLLK